jgi:formate-dependent nitrite reductase membrane component NrfD
MSAEERPVPAGRAPPVKKAPWEWYLPVYFWAGGVAAGGWLAATAEDWGGAGERAVVRPGRYLAVGGILGGTALLILDLGRSERFLNMLRIVRPRSAMSLGSWGLAAFGTATGAAAALQAAEDRFGPTSAPARLSRGGVGRALHLAALPLALFVGTYTGTLLSSTSTPAWERRRLSLPPLFLASGAASGIAATAAIAEGGRSATAGARRRLARASTVALATELALSVAGERAASTLPSHRAAPPRRRVMHTLTLLAGTAAPLVLSALRARQLARPAPRGEEEAKARPRKPVLPLVAAALSLGGSLALRFQITHEGYRSAETAADTWAVARRSLPPDLRNPPGGVS